MHRNPWFLRLILVLTALLAPSAVAQNQTQTPGPALWKVTGPHATVYLFGTVHVLPKDKPWRTPKIDAAMATSDSLWLEIPNVDDIQSMQPLIMQLGVDQAHPLSTRLTKDQLAKLDTVAKAAGIPNGEAAMEPLRPWLAAITLSGLPIARAGFDPDSGVERILKPDFVQRNKPVHGFETAEQQLHYFADLPEADQVNSLMAGLDDFDDAPARLKSMVDAWYAGDIPKLDSFFNSDFRTRYPDLYQRLIVARNKAFIQHITELLHSEGTAFVAVGAGHLVGPDGLPELLTKAGWTVNRQ